jgi:hypothetical protein
MTTNPSLDGRAAGRDFDGSTMGARRERESGKLGWFVAAILIVAAFFLLGYNERLPMGAGSAQVGTGNDLSLPGASLP